jgi:hypothetical protein
MGDALAQNLAMQHQTTGSQRLMSASAHYGRNRIICRPISAQQARNISTNTANTTDHDFHIYTASQRFSCYLTAKSADISFLSISAFLHDIPLPCCNKISSIRGAYLSLLGASAGTIGFISGLGELIGYSLRYVFGKLTDRTRKYWTMTIAGYLLDVLAVPALALVGEHGWIMACGLLVIQRMGKAIKKPAKDTIMSFAASQEGVGKSFGIQEVLDQIGAFLGPVLLYLVMLFQTDGSTFQTYATGFAFLAIPGAITIILLLVTKYHFPHPEQFEPEPKEYIPFRMKKEFILYISGISLFAFGFIDYALVVMHVSRTYATGASSLITMDTLPLLYAGAMLIDAVAALFFGLLYTKYLSFFGKEPFPCLYLRTAGQQFFQLNQSPAFIAKLRSRCTADQRIAVLFQILCGKDFACPDPDHGPLALAQLFPQQILYHRTILLQNIQPHASAFMIIPQFLTIDLVKCRNSWAIQQIVDTPGQCPLLSGIRKRYRCRIHLRKPAALRMSFHFQFLHDLLDTGRRCSIIYYHYNAPLYSHRFNKIPSASEIHLWLSALS